MTRGDKDGADWRTDDAAWQKFPAEAGVARGDSILVATELTFHCQ